MRIWHPERLFNKRSSLQKGESGARAGHDNVRGVSVKRSVEIRG